MVRFVVYWATENQLFALLLLQSAAKTSQPRTLESYQRLEVRECQAKCTLRHILLNCPMSLGRYTWRHNQALKVFCKYVTEKCEYSNAGGENKDKIVRKKGSGNSAEWKVRCDLTDQFSMPQHIVITGHLVWHRKNTNTDGTDCAVERKPIICAWEEAVSLWQPCCAMLGPGLELWVTCICSGSSLSRFFCTVWIQIPNQGRAFKART